MTSLIAKWLVVALSFLLAAFLIPGISVASFSAALILALLWGVLNLFIRPLLILFTIPLNILTFGFFTLIINGLLFWVLGAIAKGIAVDGFLPAFFGALVVSAASWVGNRFIASLSDTHHKGVHHKGDPRIFDQ